MIRKKSYTHRIPVISFIQNLVLQVVLNPNVGNHVLDKSNDRMQQIMLIFDEYHCLRSDFFTSIHLLFGFLEDFHINLNKTIKKISDWELAYVICMCVDKRGYSTHNMNIQISDIQNSDSEPIICLQR